MKARYCLIFCALMLVGCASSPRNERDSNACSPRLTWEYKRIVIEGSRFEQELNKLGAEGWEVVDHADSGGFSTVFLRRQRWPRLLDAKHGNN